jgi:acetoin utilization protein AcuB
MLTAHDLMTEDPTTISMNATVHRAVTLLQRLDVRHLPVVDPDGALVGMLSDRNVGGLAFPEVLGSVYFRRVQTALNASVSSIMSRNVLSVGLEADVAEIIELMLDRNVGAVPVVDAHGKLAGIVSYVDILREMPMREDDSDKRAATSGATLAPR